MPTDLPNQSIRSATVSPVGSALFFGTGTGILGLCAGGAIGILKSAHPGLAALYTGVQCFVLGSSASLTRDAVLAIPISQQRKSHELIASTCAGTVSGAAAGRFWGRLTFIPGGLLFGVLGYLSQRHVHRSEGVPPREKDPRTLMQRLGESRWFPIQSMSNDEYHKVLTNRLAKLDAEIALIESKLQDLRIIRDQGSESD